MTEETPVVKRGRGRPRKHPIIEREPVSAKTYKMRARANWEDFDPTAEDTPDRLRIPPHMIPDGLAAQWVTDSVLGQAVPQHRAEFERKGWTPVHQDDFEGQFNGMWMPKDKEGEINMEGLVLMVRPKEMQLKAQREDKRKAYEQVALKEAALRGGDMQISAHGFDPRHPTAIRSNVINKTMERITVPTDD